MATKANKTKGATAATKGQEIIPANQPLPVAASNISFGKLKLVKQVTLPTFKITEGIPMFFRADAAMYVGKKLKNEQKNEEGKTREPVTLLPCTQINPETGELSNQGVIVLGSVLKENLSEMYPDDAYVGKMFAVLKGAKPAGKRYHQYQISEVSV